MHRSIRVVVTRALPKEVEARLSELFDVVLGASDEAMGSDSLRDALASANVLVPTVTDSLSGEVLAGAGEQLRLIASFGAGVDHIDLDAARVRNVQITNTPGVLTEDTADLVMLLILAATRAIMVGERLLQSGNWLGWSPVTLLGQRVGGKRLGIIGLGRIGQAVARRARAFGMLIHYHGRRRGDLALEQELEATWWESLDQMLAHMDVVSINCPHTPATYHLLSERRLKLLPRHAVIVNTARGEIINERVLTRMLMRGEIAGAGLDVYEHEPRVPRALLALPNVVALPHMGSATKEARLDMGMCVIDNILAFAEGRSPPNLVGTHEPTLPGSRP